MSTACCAAACFSLRSAPLSAIAFLGPARKFRNVFLYGWQEVTMGGATDAVDAIVDATERGVGGVCCQTAKGYPQTTKDISKC